MIEMCKKTNKILSKHQPSENKAVDLKELPSMYILCVYCSASITDRYWPHVLYENPICHHLIFL